jgi:hypothetical protein
VDSGSPSSEDETVFFYAVVDALGNVTVLWVDSVTGICKSSTRPSGTNSWGSPVDVSLESQGVAGTVFAVVDSSGTVTVAFFTLDGSNCFLRAAKSVLGPSGHVQWQQFPDPLYVAAPTVFINKCILCVDSAGNVTAVWSVTDGSINSLIASTQVNDSWQPSSPIVSGAQVSTAFFSAEDPFGNVTVVWNTIVDPHDPSTWIVQSSAKPFGGSWHPPETVPCPFSYIPFYYFPIDLFADRSGNLTLGVIHFDGSFEVAQALKKPYGGTWQPPKTISATGYDSYPSQMAVYPDGRAIIALSSNRADAVEIQSVTNELLPLVTSVSPTGGTPSGGTEVTVTGERFDGALGVLFGSTPALSYALISSTTITAIAPPGVGTVDVRVIAPQGTSLIVEGDQYTYLGPAPLPPSHFRGEVKKRRGHHRKHPYRLTAKWLPSHSSNVAVYRVYKRSKVVGIIPAQSQRTFRDHLRWRGSTKKFSVVAVGVGTFESTPAKLKVRH